MNRPNSAEEQEAARLEEYLNTLRHVPLTDPSNDLDPMMAEITRLAAESERTNAQGANQYLEAARKRVWQKALASVEIERTTAQSGVPVVHRAIEGQSKAKSNRVPAYLPAENPVRKPRQVNWPRLVLGGMAATILVIAGVFGLLLLTPGPQTRTGPVGAGAVQVTPGKNALTTANPAVQATPTQPAQPTPTPYPSYKLILQIAADKFTNEQAQATAKVLENRMLALGFAYAKATVDGNQINMDLRGTVDENVVKQTASAVGRVEFVDTTGGASIQVGDRLQTTYCTSGSLLNPQAGLCVPTAAVSNPKFTPVPSGRSTQDEKPFQTIITGDDMDPSGLQLGKSDIGSDKLIYKFKPEAAAIMKNFTETNLGHQMAITIDGAVIVNATIQGVISDAGELTSPSKLSLNDLIAFVKSGPLPLPLFFIDIS